MINKVKEYYTGSIIFEKEDGNSVYFKRYSPLGAATYIRVEKDSLKVFENSRFAFYLF